MPGLVNILVNRAGYILEDIFAFISAPKCHGCGEILENPRLTLCCSCDDKLVFTGDGPVCLLCRSPEAVNCRCGRDRRYPVPRLYYWAPYDEVVRSLIHSFKFERQYDVGKYLISKALKGLAGRLREVDFDLIIPIPMVKRDKKRRTFNQTELMAEYISHLTERPVAANVLKKVKPTRLQADLGRDDRWLNIADVFRAESSELIAGRSILIVDDIVTTGATCLEAARVLHTEGAGVITVFSIASSHLDETESAGWN